MIFLSMPYRSPRQSVVEERLRFGRKVEAEFLKQDTAVRCPVIAHHETIEAHGLSKNYNDWKPMITRMMGQCEEMGVLKIPGYLTSEGVENEIRLAGKIRLEWSFITPWDVGVPANYNLNYGLKEKRIAAQICTGEKTPGHWEWRGEQHIRERCDCDLKKGFQF